MVCGMSTSNDLWLVQAEYAACRKCGLHRNRRRSIRGEGGAGASVMFVLDRLDPREVGGGQFPGSVHRSVLELLLQYAGRRPEEFYYTPVTACPPRDPRELADEQIVPLAKGPDIVTCSPRVHAEIHAVQPKVVVACGQAAAKSLLPVRTPNIQNSAGSLVEALMRGEHVDYPVPVMLTNSLQDLAKTDPDDPASPWEATCQHILHAIQLADRLIQMETYNG